MGLPLAEPLPDLPGAFWCLLDFEQVPGTDFLTPAERRLHDLLGTESRRLEWRAGRGAARSVTRALGAGACSVLRGPEGAPRLEGPGATDVEVAITHGHAHAAAVGATTRGPYPHLGIDWVDARDVARIRRIAHRVLKPDEAELCANRDDALKVAWGAREALTKATRTGMFAFGLSKIWLTAIDLPAGTASVNLDGAVVRFAPAADGALVVFASITADARAQAQAEASP